MEFSLLGAALLAALAAYGVLWWEATRGNAADCSRDVWDTMVAAAVTGLVVGRLAAMVLAGTNPVARPADFLVIRGGVDPVWATVGALAAFGWLARREPGALGDAAAAAALAGLAAWHAGCLVRDGAAACLGTVSDLPWAVAPGGETLSRHPVELYAALLLAAAVVAAAWWRRRSPPPGSVAIAAFTAAAGARLVTEPLRLAIGGGPAGWYALGVVAGLAALGFSMARLKFRPPISDTLGSDYST